MKRLLVVVTRGEVGGAQACVVTLAKSLTAKGWDVTVGYGKGTGTFVEGSMRAADIKTISFAWLGRSFAPWNNLLFIRELKRHLDRNAYDAVHLNSSNALIGGIAAKWSHTKPKTAFTFHGLSFLDPNHKNGLTGFVAKIAFRFLLRFVDTKVFVTEGNRAYAEMIGLGNGGVVIPNATDTVFMERDEARKALEAIAGKEFENSFLIGTVGRLAYPKNQEFLVRAMAGLPERALCAILGEGPDRPHLEAAIRDAKLERKAFLLGNVPDAGRHMKAFDLFVLPSIYEGAPMTLIDALRAGIPTLVSDVGGMPGMVAEPDEQIFKLDDEGDFIRKARAIMESPELTARLARENAEWERSFSPEAMADAYAAIF